MNDADYLRLQGTEHELRSEVAQLRAQLKAALGKHVDPGRAHTMPANPDMLYLAIEKSRTPMVLTDPNQPDNPIIFVNRAFQELSGYDESELLGHNCRFMQGADTDQGQIKKLGQALASHEEIALDILNYHRDGTPFLNNLFISPIFDQDGSLLYYFASQTDVTERRRDRRLVEEGSRRQRAIFDSAADLAIVATDRDSRITDWNSGAESIFGWTAEEMLGSSSRCFFTPEDRAEGRPDFEMRKALADGRAVNERWHIRKDGTRFWASGEMLPLRAEDGMHIGYLKVVRDRTEQHLAGEHLAASEERYRTLFEAIDAGFCVIELMFDAGEKPVDYRFIEINPAFERHTGLGNAHGRLMRDLAPQHEQYWFDTFGQVALTGEPVRVEHAAAELGRWFDVQAFRVGDPATRRVAVLFNDVSKRRQMEKDLQALTTSLETEVALRTGELMATEETLRQSQKMEAVGQLTGGLAHDFNNLLTGIIGSLELMQTRIAQSRTNELDRYIDAAQASAVRAASLTHRLLAFSRRQTLDPKPTEVNRLIAGMQELISRTVGPAITLVIVPFPELWPTMVDPNQLENALLNLCINSRDAMPNGGVLTVETANTVIDGRTAREWDLLPGGYVSLLVSDTGVGMEPDVIERAFDPFFTTKPIGAGTGLGLSMIYGFAKQSGGQVRIQSSPGMGTTIPLYLPRLRGVVATEPVAASSQGAPRARNGETVLVVDDEPVVRMLVVEVLEDLGYSALQAGNSRDGLQRLDEAGRIDLLVTDVGLPDGINGRQLADAARVRRPELKVLFITGYAESAVVGSGMMEHGMEVMIKPFVMNDLAARIQAMLRS